MGRSDKSLILPSKKAIIDFLTVIMNGSVALLSAGGEGRLSAAETIRGPALFMSIDNETEQIECEMNRHSERLPRSSASGSFTPLFMESVFRGLDRIFER